VYAVGGAVLVILITIGVAMVMTTGKSGTAGLIRLSDAPLGVNIAPWDSDYANQNSLVVIQRRLKAAGIHQLRYGGGSYADSYNWQTNTSIRNCLPEDPSASFTSACASSGELSFTQFSRQAKSLGADSFVTVNYGSGMPAEAASWVSDAKNNPRNRVALWEVGNENYGCWEVNNELAGAPEYYHGYKPSLYNTASADVEERQTCPQVKDGDAAGTQILATSYTANAQRFMQKMKAADPTTKIGVPWAFGEDVQGAYVPDSSEWNNSVLKADGKYVNFVDAHYYPYKFYGSVGGTNPNGARVLGSLVKIPMLYASIRAELDALDPSASVVVGETAVSSNATTATCTPLGAVFAAGDALSWLAVGAESVDWWYMNDDDNTALTCDKPGSGLLTYPSPPTPETPYYGYFLASLLAQPGAMLGRMANTEPFDVLSFQAVLPGGKYAVAFINLNTRIYEKVTFHTKIKFSGALRTWCYSAADQNRENSEINMGSVTAAAVANTVRLPPESIMVLKTE
jgi:hypothetical protein